MKKYTQVVRRVVSGKQIVMFPFGGGSGYSYMPIINQLPKDIEVIVINPPGHMINGGKPFENIPEMVYWYSKELRLLLRDKPLFFGHSIGGGIAYETAKELKNSIPITNIVISSILPPHCIMDTVDLRSDMDTELLIQKCSQMGGLPEIFKAEEVLLEGFLIGLRGDLKALENYSASPQGLPHKLDIAATMLYSDNDYIVDLDKLKQWDRYLDVRTSIPFKGDHFYLFEESNCRTVARILAEQT